MLLYLCFQCYNEKSVSRNFMNVTRYFLQLLPVKEMTYHFSANLILSLVQKTIFPNISKVDKRYQLNVLKNKVLKMMKTNAMQRVLPTDTFFCLAQSILY